MTLNRAAYTPARTTKIDNMGRLTVGVCRVHFLRNVLAQVPKGSAEMVAAAIRTIFAQPDARTCVNSSG